MMRCSNRFTSSVASSSAIDLAWSDNSSNETEFWLERSLNGSDGWFLIELPAGTESYRDGGLSASTRYYYRLSAWNPNGPSEGYTTADATTLDAPQQPALTLSATGSKNKGEHVIDLLAGEHLA